jgi:SMI1 / KNR4 family (SUKH-1)
MPSAIERLLAQMQKNPGASEASLRDLVEKTWVALPEWYLNLLRISNGAEGSVGSSYLGLWPAEEVITHNCGYRVQEFHPGMLMFGSSMGGVAYAFDDSDGKVVIVEIPFDSIAPEDVRRCGDTLEDFLQFLIYQFDDEAQR